MNELLVISGITSSSYREKLPLVFTCITIMLLCLYSIFNPFFSYIHGNLSIPGILATYTKHDMQSPYCEIECKNGKRCSNLYKTTHEDKNVCLLHHRLLKVSEEHCSICMDAMSQRNSMKITSCGHFFHKECLTKWAEQNKDTCPLCRTPMDSQTLVTVNRGMLDYIGTLMFTLPQEQRQLVLYHIMNVIDGAFAMHQQQAYEQPTPPNTQMLRQPSTGTYLHSVVTPMGQFPVFEDRNPHRPDNADNADVSSIPYIPSIPVYDSVEVPMVPRDPRIPALTMTP